MMRSCNRERDREGLRFDDDEIEKRSDCVYVYILSLERVEKWLKLLCIHSLLPSEHYNSTTKTVWI